MANKNNNLELVFDCLYHELIAHVPKLIPKAKEEYRQLTRDLPIADKRKLAFIDSLLDYCEQERWALAKTQLAPAEHEYRRYFLDGVSPPPKPVIHEIHSKQLKEYPEYNVTGSRESDRTTEAKASAKAGTKRQEQNTSISAPFNHVTTSLEGVHTPTQISAAFGQIFNNEWKSAIYELEQLKIYERQAIGCLFTIVIDAYRVCKIEAENQITKLESAAFSIMMEGTFVDKSMDLGGNRKYLLQYRQEIADVCVERLQESFRRRYLPEIIRKVGIYQSVRTHGPVNKYANQCIALCWRMVVLDPPVYMVDDRYSPALFKPEMYNYHTMKGQAVAYYVWPALLKYKDGPLLCKGIAQGQ